MCYTLRGGVVILYATVRGGEAPPPKMGVCLGGGPGGNDICIITKMLIEIQ